MGGEQTAPWWQEHKAAHSHPRGSGGEKGRAWHSANLLLSLFDSVRAPSSWGGADSI